jgi:lysozyme
MQTEDQLPNPPDVKHFLCGYIAIFVALVTIFGELPAHAEVARQALTDDLSRGQLAELELAVAPDPEDREIISEFAFPDDANDGIYGIDVSHHNGQLQWGTIPLKNISFVYVKASQGTNFYDDKFAGNWVALQQLRTRNSHLRRGAYHFLAARGAASDQAKIFLDTLDQSGGMDGMDLPAVLDMECDVIIRNHHVVLDANKRPVDQWKDVAPADISTKALEWLDIVEKQTKKRPIIYTNTFWWKDHMGSKPAFAKYTIWIADYRKSSINAGAPGLPAGVPKALWQFTDHGSIKVDAGTKLLFDASNFAGDQATFDKL